MTKKKRGQFSDRIPTPRPLINVWRPVMGVTVSHGYKQSPDFNIIFHKKIDLGILLNMKSCYLLLISAQEACGSW